MTQHMDTREFTTRDGENGVLEVEATYSFRGGIALAATTVAVTLNKLTVSGVIDSETKQKISEPLIDAIMAAGKDLEVKAVEAEEPAALATILADLEDQGIGIGALDAGVPSDAEDTEFHDAGIYH